MAKMILPNYRVNPRHLSSEDVTGEITARIEVEKEQLDVLYRASGNKIAHNVALRGCKANSKGSSTPAHAS